MSGSVTTLGQDSHRIQRQILGQGADRRMMAHFDGGAKTMADLEYNPHATINKYAFNLTTWCFLYYICE
jgi:hypothetical protein